MNKKMIKNEKAITLIALVITIVVLIILAGVAISLSLGENGIFNKAKEAKRMQLEAEYKEKIGTDILAAQIDAIARNEELEDEQVKDIISNYGELQDDGDTIKIRDEDIEVSLSDIYTGTTTSSGSYTDNKAKIAMLEKRVKELQEQLDNLSLSGDEKDKKIAELNKKITELEEKITELETKIAALEKEMADAKKTIIGTISGIEVSEKDSFDTIAAGVSKFGENKYSEGYNSGYSAGYNDGYNAGYAKEQEKKEQINKMKTTGSASAKQTSTGYYTTGFNSYTIQNTAGATSMTVVSSQSASSYDKTSGSVRIYKDGTTLVASLSNSSYGTYDITGWTSIKIEVSCSSNSGYWVTESFTASFS